MYFLKELISSLKFAVRDHLGWAHVHCRICFVQQSIYCKKTPYEMELRNNSNYEENAAPFLLCQIK